MPRTSRLPTLRRFRRARQEAAVAGIERRAEAVATVAAEVTALVTRTQNGLSSLRAERLRATPSRRAALQAGARDRACALRASLAERSRARAEAASIQSQARRAARAAVRTAAFEIISTDFR